MLGQKCMYKNYITKANKLNDLPFFIGSC